MQKTSPLLKQGAPTGLGLDRSKALAKARTILDNKAYVVGPRLERVLQRELNCAGAAVDACNLAKV
jgi:hypothetical protein